MAYARARLWLGISGVGTMVVVSAAMLASRAANGLFPQRETWSFADVAAICGFVFAIQLVMMPFDVIGGYLLPTRFSRSNVTFRTFLRQWAVGVGVQAVLFVITGLAILAFARPFGIFGGAAGVIGFSIVYLHFQGVLTRLLTDGQWDPAPARLEAIEGRLERWGLAARRLLVVNHFDAGFTGGVVGLPGRETIVVPRQWFDSLSDDELAAAIARRIEAIVSGGRTRGLLVALAWTVTGFILASLLPGGGLRSVAQLVTTCCGFTCWTFLGLLVLPRLSRRASYGLDTRVIEVGVPQELLHDTLGKLDRLQDDEPHRPSLVEAIFHPVPSLDNRRRASASNRVGAWHVARMMLFLSWSCMGLLSRAVHCNAGRPELWAMLPTD